MKPKENLIENLKNDVFVRLGVSKIQGVGVFAVKDIPLGTQIFACCNGKQALPIEVSCEDLKEIEHPVIEYMQDFIVETEACMYHLPYRGLNSMHIMFYLNHSDNPNAKAWFGGEADDYVKFATCKDVKKGEELTEDYRYLSDDKEKIYKQFPFLLPL